MPGRSTSDVMSAMRILIEKYMEGQKELHCIFVDLEEAYDKVPRDELWYGMRNSGVNEKYVSVVQDMYENSLTEAMCAVGTTERLMYQGSTLSPLLYAMIMDKMTDGIKQESSIVYIICR
ncbi:uncharacterized protein LOC122251735 [Penaeus japonicus]|uniref:uncharacterized protein LOC122251735 n=1 Tax=Penaeus japonicus TaxID=27405 RepID=UPI001C70DF65|nr:uncharacterized protein LOC122251735 [Penaeus japonicus]